MTAIHVARPTDYGIEIKFGLIFSAVLLGWLALEYAVGLHTTYLHLHPYATNLFFFPAVTVMALGLRARKRALGGVITFKQAFLSGLLISAIVAALSPVLMVIFVQFINPNFFADFQRYAVVNGVSTAEEAAAYFNLNSYMWQSAIGALIMGALTSAAIAWLIRSKPTRARA